MRTEERRRIVRGVRDDHLQTETRERLASLRKIQMSAERLKLQGVAASELGPHESVPAAEARAILNDWPEAPKTVGEKLLEHYGPPNEATPTKLFWYRNGPWAAADLRPLVAAGELPRVRVGEPGFREP
jgi:hypothetical protein